MVMDGPGRPDPEVPERLERARRRQFTVGYKLRVLSEADATRTTGEIGAVLRREGLYSSHLAAWRRQREEGILNALSPRRRGRPTSSPDQRELARLRQENERLGQRLVVAEAVIEIQKSLVLAWAGGAEPAERRVLLMANVAELAPVAPLPSPSPRSPEEPREGAAGERSELSGPGPTGVETAPDAPATSAPTTPTRVHPRALGAPERAAVLETLRAPRFQDAAPAAVYATLLDEGTYLASERTMYRLLAAEGETRPRRDQLVHPSYAKPCDPEAARDLTLGAS